MNTNSSAGNAFLRRAQSKDTKNLAHLEIVNTALYGEPKTILMVSVETGLNRRKIRLLIAEIRKTGDIRNAGKTYCQHSGHKAEYYTTSPEYMYSVKYGWRISIVKPSKKQLL